MAWRDGHAGPAEQGAPRSADDEVDPTAPVTAGPADNQASAAPLVDGRPGGDSPGASAPVDVGRVGDGPDAVSPVDVGRVADGAAAAAPVDGGPVGDGLGVAPPKDAGAVGDEAGATEWAVPGQVGIGPWPGGQAVWPDDDRLDPQLLATGDARNVVDAYRYWRRDAVAADLAARAHPFHVAIENFGHDHNIGTVVRTANAFGAAGVHIVGRRRWNRRGAMVTDRYLAVHHHDDVTSLTAYAEEHGLVVVAVDNTPGAERLETARLPRECLLLFGQEGPGVTGAARAAARMTVSIAQFGSTRSINAGVAAGIAMHAWIRQHADLTRAW